MKIIRLAKSIAKVAMPRATKVAMPMKEEHEIPKDYHLKVGKIDFTSQGGHMKNFVTFSLEHTNRKSRIGFLTAVQSAKDPRVWWTMSKADKGWGPYLYDKAMEYVSGQGGHLISHQEAYSRGLIGDHVEGKKGNLTSDDAKNVWDFYEHKREDVEKTDLGFRMKQMEPMELAEATAKIKIIKTSSGFKAIYRAVPAFATEFRNMDYVTMSREWAIEHAKHVSAMDDEPAIVLRAVVNVSDIEDAYNPREYRYVGTGVVGKEVYRTNTEEEQ